MPCRYPIVWSMHVAVISVWWFRSFPFFNMPCRCAIAWSMYFVVFSIRSLALLLVCRRIFMELGHIVTMTRLSSSSRASAWHAVHR